MHADTIDIAVLIALTDRRACIVTIIVLFAMTIIILTTIIITTSAVTIIIIAFLTIPNPGLWGNPCMPNHPASTARWKPHHVHRDAEGTLKETGTINL